MDEGATEPDGRKTGERKIGRLLAPLIHPRDEAHAGHDEAYELAVGRALAARLPALYLALMCCIGFVGYQFVGTVSPVVSILVPSVIALVMMARIRDWRRYARASDGAPALLTAIRRMYIVGPAVASAVMLWAGVLYQYGDEMQRALIQQYVAITGVLCAISLLPAPRLAMWVSLIGMGLAQLSYFSRPHPLALPSFVMQVVTMAVITFVAFRYRKESDELIDARREGERRVQAASRTAEREREIASQDFLTGLLNRRAFQHAIQQAVERGEATTLALVDLDDFKGINDTHGHLVGDAVLRAVGKILQGHEAQALAIGRIGGDEFALLWPGQADFAPVAHRLFAKLAQPVDVGGWMLGLRASVGFIQAGGGTLRPDDLLERADRAMYEAKRSGRGVVAFDARLEQRMVDRNAIRRAAASGGLAERIELVYQPLFDIARGRTAGFETLARWSAHGESTVDTATFVRVAEENGLIGQVSLAVMRRMLADLPRFDPAMRVGMNLSGLDFATDATVEKLLAMIEESGNDPRRIVMEITETAVIRDPAVAIARMHLIKSKGVRIALDDYGIGQSGLKRLVELPVDAIKLDRTFARMLPTSERARAVVASTRALASDLGLRLTQEGIETGEEMDRCVALGLDLVQGFYIGAPMPLDKALAFDGARFLARHEARGATAPAR